MNPLDYRYSKRSETGAKTFTVVEKIWGHYFMCTVPTFQSRTLKDIERKGVHVTGIKSLDDGIKNGRERRLLTINQMIDFFMRNVMVGVVNYDDTKEIYDTVQTHLLQWVETLRSGMNLADAPIEELIAMDKFANAVFPHARHLILPEAIHSAMANHVAQSQLINPLNFFNEKLLPSKVSTQSTTINPIDPEKDKDGLPIRDSLTEKFKESLAGLRRY